MKKRFQSWGSNLCESGRHKTNLEFGKVPFNLTVAASAGPFTKAYLLGMAWSSALALEKVWTCRAKDFVKASAFPLYLAIPQASLTSRTADSLGGWRC